MRNVWSRSLSQYNGFPHATWWRTVISQLIRAQGCNWEASAFLSDQLHALLTEAPHTLSPQRACPSSGATTPRIQGAPVPFSFLVWAGVGDLELAEDTGLARSAYMSSESTLCTELLLDVALDTEETLLTLRDLDTHEPVCTYMALTARWAGDGELRWGWGGGLGAGFYVQFPQLPFLRNVYPPNLKFQRGHLVKVTNSEGTLTSLSGGSPSCLLGRDIGLRVTPE